MRSIRGYLLSRILGGSALVLVAAGLGVYLAVARSLEAQFDRNLADRVQGLASLLFQVADHVEFEFSDELMPEYDRAEAPAYFELAYADGTLLERSNSLGEAELEAVAPAGPAVRHWSAPLPDGRAGRFAQQLVEVHHVYPEEGPERPDAARVAILVARGREDLVAAEREVLGACILVSLLLLGLFAGVSWVAVDRGLEPARRLAGALGALRPNDLPERLEVGELPAELAPVAETTDQLVRRVDEALERERRTSADIAHELRTPTAEILTVSEVALRDGDDPEGTRYALRTVRDVSSRMGRAVATLLHLARLEGRPAEPASAEVDLGALVAELLRSLTAVGRERGLVVDNAVGEREPVRADPDALRIVVANLLGNAVDYAPRASRIACGLERGDGRWRLVVENDAPELAPSDLAALTEPFWRKDRARADRSRAGLGLALSRALAERTGLRLEFRLAAGRLRAEVARPEPEAR